MSIKPSIPIALVSPTSVIQKFARLIHDSLQGRLEARRLVEKAKGVLMLRYAIGSFEALAEDEPEGARLLVGVLAGAGAHPVPGSHRLARQFGGLAGRVLEGEPVLSRIALDVRLLRDDSQTDPRSAGRRCKPCCDRPRSSLRRTDRAWV